MDNFRPPLILRNANVQSVLASVGPRRYAAMRRASLSGLYACTKSVVIQTPGGVRLAGLYSGNGKSVRGLVTLIHGWEGSAASSYMISAAAALFAEGFSVFRLNLRDHGGSHALNPEIFHSARIAEVVEAVGEVGATYGNGSHFLAGFSLGGNFSLRVAGLSREAGLNLKRVAAVCPVINARNAMAKLNTALPFYKHYFLRKWKNSLRLKEKCFPGLLTDEMLNSPDLDTLTDRMLETYTSFKNSDEYYANYSITGERLAGLGTDCHILMSADDPVIPVVDFEGISSLPRVKVEIAPWGGHCGFLMNLKFESYADKKLVEIFTGTAEKVGRA